MNKTTYEVEDYSFEDGQPTYRFDSTYRTLDEAVKRAAKLRSNINGGVVRIKITTVVYEILH